MSHWTGPADWQTASSGGYFWRYIGSEGDRDVYEFIVVFGKRLPADPDDTAKVDFVQYSSFRNAPLELFSQHGFSLKLIP